MKVAILLRGAMSTLTGRFCTQGSLYNNTKFIDYVACYNSIVEHIINANPNYSFDFYIQSWNPSLQSELVSLYKPIASIFENNDIYSTEINTHLNNTRQPPSNYGINSHFKSISKVARLLLASERHYDKVILYRPDLLLYKDMILDTYDNDKIYVNGHINCGGDFHFVMNMENIALFVNLYETTKSINPVTTHELHGKIKVFVEYFLKKQLYMDSIIPGLHQEVLRKLRSEAIRTHNLDIKLFFRYGLSEDYINNLP